MERSSRERYEDRYDRCLSRSFLLLSQPEGYLGGLERLCDHREHIGRELVEIDLIPEPGSKRHERASRVIFPPIEAPIDDCLQPASKGLEKSGDHERRDHDRDVRALSHDDV